MTTEQHLQLHDQMIASIERNLSALVEAQQKSELEIAASQRVVIGLGQMVERGLGLLLDVSRNVKRLTGKVDELAERQLEADERQRRLDERMDSHCSATSILNRAAMAANNQSPTRFTGRPARKASTLSILKLTRRCTASSVPQATWGLTSRRG